jgi:hypothetical protein
MDGAEAIAVAYSFLKEKHAGNMLQSLLPRKALQLLLGH